jgi:hypothetical protein
MHDAPGDLTGYKNYYKTPLASRSFIIGRPVFKSTTIQHPRRLVHPSVQGQSSHHPIRDDSSPGL